MRRMEMQKTEARGARRCGLGPRMALRRPAAAFPAPSSESDCILLSPQPPSPPPLLPPYIPLSPPCPSRRRSATSLPSLLLSPPWPAPSMRCPLPSRLAPAAATSARERSDPLGTRLSKTPANERGRLIWRPSHRLPSRASVVLLEPEHGRKDPRYVAPSTNPLLSSLPHLSDLSASGWLSPCPHLPPLCPPEADRTSHPDRTTTSPPSSGSRPSTPRASPGRGGGAVLPPVILLLAR